MDRTHQPSSDLQGSAAPGSETQTSALSFAGLRLEADGTLFRGETPLHLPPRELAALRLLLARAGKIVTPAEVKQALWGELHVTADSVPRLLSSLRAHLHPDNCIQTVYKRGYRFFAAVEQGDFEAAPILPRLAIPPFTIETGVPVHLGTLLAEETMALLSNAQMPQASVLARDSVFSLAQRGLTAQQIGESLRADMVLAGTLRSFPAHFRLRMEMIRVADGIQIWVEDLLIARHATAGIESDLVNRIDFHLKSRPFDSWPLAAESPQLVKSSLEKKSGAATQRDLSSRGRTSGSEEDLYPGARLAEPANANAVNPSTRETLEMFLRARPEWQSRERTRLQEGPQQLILRRQT